MRRFLEPVWLEWHAAWGPPAPTCPAQWTCVRSSAFIGDAPVLLTPISDPRYRAGVMVATRLKLTPAADAAVANLLQRWQARERKLAIDPGRMYGTYDEYFRKDRRTGG